MVQYCTTGSSAVPRTSPRGSWVRFCRLLSFVVERTFYITGPCCPSPNPPSFPSTQRTRTPSRTHSLQSLHHSCLRQSLVYCFLLGKQFVLFAVFIIHSSVRYLIYHTASSPLNNQLQSPTMVRFGTLLPILAGLLGVANAHARVYSLWVNGVDQGDGRGIYIRSPPSDSPVKDGELSPPPSVSPRACR
jgi:hypothetical protein